MHSVVLHLVDSSGKCLISNKWCDVLLSKKRNPEGAEVIVLRVPFLDDDVKAYMKRISKSNKKNEED